MPSLNSQLVAGAYPVTDIKTSGADARIAGDSSNVEFNKVTGGKKNKSRKNQTWRKMGGKKQSKRSDNKRKSVKKTRSRSRK